MSGSFGACKAPKALVSLERASAGSACGVVGLEGLVTGFVELQAVLVVRLVLKVWGQVSWNWSCDRCGMPRLSSLVSRLWSRDTRHATPVARLSSLVSRLWSREYVSPH